MYIWREARVQEICQAGGHRYIHYIIATDVILC